MKITIDCKDFLKGVTAAGSSIKTPHTLPILENILIEISEGKITLTGDNLEVRSCITIDVIGLTGSLSVCVPYNLLLAMLKGFPSVPIELNFNKKQLTLSTSNAEYNVPIIDSADYPKPALKESESEITVDPAILVEGVKKALVFTSKSNDMISSSNNVMLSFKETGSRILSTDGYAMLFEFSMPDVKGDMNLIISRQIAGHLDQNLTAYDEIKICKSKSHVFFSMGNREIIGVLSNVEFKDFDIVFDRLVLDKSLNIDKDVIAPAIKRMYAITDMHHRTIVFSLSPGALELSFKNKDFNYNAKEVLQCEYDGESLVIGFAADYFNNMLSVTDEDVKMSMTANNAPCLFTAENVRALLSPRLID